MTKTMTFTATACFLFALAFVAALGIAEEAQASLNPCCIIPCQPPLTGPGHWGYYYLNTCQTAWDPANCQLLPGGCAMP
jgi:hypothetical protein